MGMPSQVLPTDQRFLAFFLSSFSSPLTFFYYVYAVQAGFFHPFDTSLAALLVD